LRCATRSEALARAIAIACIAAVSWGATPPQPDPLAGFRRAVALQQQGQLDAAVLAYRDFLIAQPNNLAGLSNLAVVLVRLGRYQEAITEYQRALALDPRNAAVRLNLAIAHYKSAQFGEAVAELERVRALQPQADNLQATLLEADCHLRLGQHKDVITLLEPVESRHPDDLAVAYLLGMAYLRDGRADRGQMRIDRILRNGESAEAHVLMGIALRESHDLAGAVKAFAKAVAIDPSLPDVHALYGQALAASGDRARALEEFEAELRADPNDYTANINLGVMAKEDERLDEAGKFLDRALRVRPGDAATRYQLATLRMAKGDVPAAQQMLETLVSEHPDWLEPHVSLATVYYRLKRRADADRERAIVDELTRQAQAKQPGATPAPPPPPPPPPPKPQP
jgi:tetratricopeptide (TPR) repeat protein